MARQPIDDEAYIAAKRRLRECTNWTELGQALSAARNALGIVVRDMGVSNNIATNIETARDVGPNGPQVSGKAFFSYCAELGVALNELPEFAATCMLCKRKQAIDYASTINRCKNAVYDARNWTELGQAVEDLIRRSSRSATHGTIATRCGVPKEAVKKLCKGQGNQVLEYHTSILQGLGLSINSLPAFVPRVGTPKATPMPENNDDEYARYLAEMEKMKNNRRSHGGWRGKKPNDEPPTRGGRG